MKKTKIPNEIISHLSEGQSARLNCYIENKTV